MSNNFITKFICDGWNPVIARFKLLPEKKKVCGICQEILDGAKIYPPHPFEILNMIDPSEVKIVILGQDPYHTRGLANGIAFAVNVGCKIPPSLTNILEEVRREYNLGSEWNPSGDLINWVHQGVLLLNVVLTVEEGVPNSHAGMGWEVFTKMLIHHVLEVNPNTIFILWGRKAQEHVQDIENIQYKIETPHPSPFSAHKGFLGSDCFRVANDLLLHQGRKPIDWTDLI